MPPVGCRLRILLSIVTLVGSCWTRAHAQQIVGAQIVPHQRSAELKWRSPTEKTLSARVELFVKNQHDVPLTLDKDQPPLFDQLQPTTLVDNGLWAWTDNPSLWIDTPLIVPPDALVVYSFNGASSRWAPKTQHTFQFSQQTPAEEFELSEPDIWISSLTFLATDDDGNLTNSPFPNRITAHIKNASAPAMQMQYVRTWVPGGDTPSPFVFFPQNELTLLNSDCFPADGRIAPGEQGGFEVDVDRLPLGSAVVEVGLVQDSGRTRSLWAHLKIKSEAFDISGGWVASKTKAGNALTHEPYLQTLQRMHINTGQIEEVSGYTDNPSLYARYPLKRFNRLSDLQRYDRDELLPTIHAVEFIGEPQYGGGRPVPPQEVHELLQPYRSSRLPTSVTLSEERNWHLYAGLSDYPHYDAYRVIAPAADYWRGYDRWNGERIGWGAPLETIGTMTRSLREHSRPKPIAYWAQGAHDGWGGLFSPRRGSPTPDELRAQAWHGLGNHVTSLYWFNLSLKSLLKYPDLISPITQVNREARMLDDFFLRADAFHTQRLGTMDSPQWEVTSLVSADAALYVVHDLAYEIDSTKNVFLFSPREFTVTVPVPRWLADAEFLSKIDGNSVSPLPTPKYEAAHLRLAGTVNVVGLYLLSKSGERAERIKAKLENLIAAEEAVDMNPAENPADLDRLRRLLTP